MEAKKNAVTRLVTLVEDIWQNPMLGFDLRFAELHRHLEEALAAIQKASVYQVSDPVSQAMRNDMHDTLARAMDLFDVMYEVDGNVPDDMFESENFKLFSMLLSASYGFADQLSVSASAQLPLPFIGPMQNPGMPGSAVVPITTGEKSVAYVFSQNLKQVLREEGVTLYEFLHKGPISDQPSARELIMGRTLPSLSTVKRIAQAYRIDPDRLLKNIMPELLRTVIV